MKDLVLMSLGGTSETADQIRRFAKGRLDLCSVSGPFDETVTSFDALRYCLEPGTNPQSILAPEYIELSSNESGLCKRSGLIFDRTLSFEAIYDLGGFQLPGCLLRTKGVSKLLEQVRENFQRDFQNLFELKQSERTIIFVRHRPAFDIESAFFGIFEYETDEQVANSIKNFIGHENFILFSISCATLAPYEKSRERVFSLEENGRIFSCQILEPTTESFPFDEGSGLSRALEKLVQRLKASRNDTARMIDACSF